MSKKIMILAVLGLFVAAAGTLQARPVARQGGAHQGESGWHGKGGFGKKIGKRMVVFMRNRLSDKLDLSAEQEKKVEAILTAKAEKAKALMEEARKKGDALREEGSAEIRAILTKEQAEKFDRVKSRMERRRAERRARWSGGEDDGE